MRRVLLLPVFGVFLAGAMPLPSHTTQIEKIQPYRAWYCATPEALDMSAKMALLCSLPPQWYVSPDNPHQPHVFKLYVNPIGKKAFIDGGSAAFPIGSIVVKEKFALPKSKDSAPRTLPKDAKPTLLTAMVKRKPGFEPKTGDWEFLVLTGDAKKQTDEGHEACAKCHQDAKRQDFVFTRGIRNGWPPLWHDR